MLSFQKVKEKGGGILTFAFGLVPEVSAHHFWLMLHRFSKTDSKARNQLLKTSSVLLSNKMIDWALFCNMEKVFYSAQYTLIRRREFCSMEKCSTAYYSIVLRHSTCIV